MSLVQPVGTATARMTRVLFVGTALTGIAFAALSLGHAFAQAPLMNPLWETVVSVLLWTIPVVIVASAGRAPLRWLRWCAIVLIAVYSAAIVTWPFAQEVDRIPTGVQPWIINLLPMTIFAGALVLPPIAAWGFLLVSCLAAGVLRFVADGSTNVSLSVQDTLFNIMYTAVFVAIVIVTVSAGRHRDETAERTAADAVAAAAAEAENTERALVAALTHDDVLSTLIAAARATDATAPLVRGYASRALDRLDELGSVEVEPGALVTADELLATLRATVAGLARSVRFAAPDAPAVSIPAPVARALSEATAEALRNSLLHADTGNRPTTRTVTAVVTNDAASVEVVDDGAGFDPSQLPLERFGIRLSIRHRMSLVAGGSALIQSTPGVGTRVVLSWIGGVS